MVVCSGNCGAPKGQAVTHAWHPMQKFAVDDDDAVSALFEIARVGQTAMQGASPQCMHDRETYRMVTEGYSPVSILLTCLKLEPFRRHIVLVETGGHARHAAAATGDVK